ncbi:hypothetical protein MNBD_GAMMA12-1012 [hydrothermal vent metagenome]|uniref:PilZ domain-containing protein n=1 Tax=hydrothermal vent metagenome TaxID=652676 RepID=A0A3B0YMK7_9ZZZZ
MTQAEKNSERRRFSRILIDVTVKFEHKQQQWQSKLIDISLKGMLIENPDGWQGSMGDKVIIDVPLDPETHISMNAQVSHFDELTIGYECTVIDIASIAHLRRIVELNIGNTRLLERELHALGNPDE